MFEGQHGVFTDREWTDLSSHLSLSDRQQQIAQCVLHDMSDVQIAQNLRIAVPTVRTHMGRLFVKLDVEDRTGLVLRMVEVFRQECCKQCGEQGCPRFR